MAEKKKYNSILISGRKDETLTYSKFVKDEESGESVKESLDKKVNVTDELTTQQIKDGAITNEKMAADSVGNTNLQDGSVSNEKLEDGSITNEKLAENSITKDKLKDNTIGIEKLDPELRQTINAATGLPENLVETIQNVDDTLKNHQRQLDDKQQQITANDEDISLLQTRSTQMEETIKSIAATGGASQATAVTYNNEKSKLTAVNIQSAVDEVVDKTAIKDEEGNVQDTPFRVIENEEFIKAIVDAEGRLLFGIYRDSGKPYFPQNDMYHISQSEEFLWVILDAANHPLLGIQQDGTCWAAKAQWLDDIKAIKNVLSSIDETLKTFQPKEDGKGLINLDVADSVFYISNDEYIIAVVDAEDRILAGIKYDGEPYFPNHEMYSVIANEEWLYAIIDAEDKVLGGFRADDGHMIAGNVDISTFIANAIIDIADIKERTTHLSTIENDEYLSVERDAAGKVLGYTAPDGSHYLYKVKSETIPTEFEHIEDPEGRTEITTDAENKVMSWRDSEGKKHEHDMEVTNLEVLNLNLQGNSVNNIQDALKANGFNVNTPTDWSESSFIQIPEPRFAVINITNIDSMPTTKQDNKKAFLEFWDMQGNYFKKRAILNAQGNSSMMFVKKNAAIDICNDEWVGDDTAKIRFGNWVPQDSFHLKAYYTDFFRGVGVICYKLYEQILMSRGNMTDRPWKKALIDMNSIGVTTKSLGSSLVGQLDLETDTGALCHPDGFPVALYLNGKFYGIFSWQLKKHRDNYHMNKSIAEHVHLDGDLYSNFILNGKNNINWSAFEIRNPKGLYAIGGNKYDADVRQEEIAGTDEVDAWISLGKLPDGTIITSKIQKALKLTAKVKEYINDFSETLNKIVAAKNVYESSSKTSEDLDIFTNAIEKYYDIDNLVDYEILSDIINNTDGFGKNWQWVTYDGIKWYVLGYDFDMSFGANSSGDGIVSPPTKFVGDIGYTLTYYMVHYFKDKLQARYKELSDNGIISHDNIMSLVKDWMDRIGTSFYKEEYDKWKDSPCISDSIVRDEYWQIITDDYGNPSTVTSETFNATKAYTVGQEVSFGKDADMGFFRFKCIKATQSLSSNTPHEVSDYSPISQFKHSDNIYRIEKWINKNLENMDKLYNYNRK